MERDDDFLIREYLEGDQGAFKILVEKYTPSIYNFSVRFVGEDYVKDIVQDIFIKAWKNVKKFNKSKANFKTWIFAITRNTITDYLRKKKMIPFSSLDSEEESFAENLEDEVVLPDEALIKLEDKELLNRILDKLPANYKEILILYYQEEMTFNEIGQLLSKPLNTVKSYHRRALILLRKLLEK
ncbi:MAG TPA: sigma-70 family RNA polymerase sigma factor [Candidatus Paceibacterota bacterium]|nr:sigma-70 family RNA polymerase sigma factor [Candidatus Paceibacterota bacterium]